MNAPVTQSPKKIHFAIFSGRIGRLHFFIGCVILFVLSSAFPLLPISTYINIPIQLLSLLLILALTIRRLHDIGSSGWQALLPLAVIFGMIVLMFYTLMLGIVGLIIAFVLTLVLILYYVKLFFRKGDQVTNAYGDVPSERPLIRSILNIG